MRTVIHGVRKLDANAEQPDSWVAFDGDMIVATGTGAPPDAESVIDGAARVLVPGFIDLHCHGGGGHAFDDGPEAIARALAVHRAHGTTRSVISLVSAPIDALEQSLSDIAELASRDPLVLGSHLEGPFLSPGRCGAHDASLLRVPDSDTVRRLLAAANGTLRQVTIAPELDGALDAIDEFTTAGTTVAVGHSEADYDQAAAAFQRGARILTHAFNAMPGLHHRAPGPVAAAFADDRVALELVLDGVHVHPALARIAFMSAPGRVALVTDAMAAAAAADGDYRLGALAVTVKNGRATILGTETIAGSTLLLDQALRNAVETVGATAAIEALTAAPARALGLGDRFGYVSEGYAADFVLLDDRWGVTEVWAAGEKIA